VRIPPHVGWPAAIIGALAIHVVVSLATVWVATSNPSYAVEEDYYQKAVHWDQRQAQERVNEELGWNLTLAISGPPMIGEPAELELVIADRDGRPLDGAAVSVEAFHNARADRILRAPLIPGEMGRYSASLAMRRQGVWEFRITATRGETKFTHRETRYVPLDRGTSD
jgi:nitrogen fixation protein FixH